jgi:hypothetical protein
MERFCWSIWIDGMRSRLRRDWMLRRKRSGDIRSRLAKGKIEGMR